MFFAPPKTAVAPGKRLAIGIERCARDHRELFTAAQSVLAEVIDFVNQKTQARVIYEAARSGRSDRTERRGNGSRH